MIALYSSFPSLNSTSDAQSRKKYLSNSSEKDFSMGEHEACCGNEGIASNSSVVVVNATKSEKRLQSSTSKLVAVPNMDFYKQKPNTPRITQRIPVEEESNAAQMIAQYSPPPERPPQIPAADYPQVRADTSRGYNVY